MGIAKQKRSVTFALGDQLPPDYLPPTMALLAAGDGGAHSHEQQASGLASSMAELEILDKQSVVEQSQLGDPA